MNRLSESLLPSREASTKTPALVLGDEERATWHPLSAVQSEFETILGTDFVTEYSTDYDRVEDFSRRYQPGRTGNTPTSGTNDAGMRNNGWENETRTLLVSYTDCWRNAPDDAQVAAILNHVTNGGGLLAVHCGISLQSRHELAQMIGGRFTGHPPMQDLRFHPATPADQLFVRPPDREHPEYPRVEGPGAPSILITEEPYQFEMAPLAGVTVTWTYEMNGKRYPAAWVRRFGKGRVAFAMPGHWQASMAHTGYARYLRRLARWTVGISTF